VFPFRGKVDPKLIIEFLRKKWLCISADPRNVATKKKHTSSGNKNAKMMLEGNVQLYIYCCLFALLNRERFSLPAFVYSVLSGYYVRTESSFCVSERYPSRFVGKCRQEAISCFCRRRALSVRRDKNFITALIPKRCHNKDQRRE